jgi:hypothetical protein
MAATITSLDFVSSVPYRAPTRTPARQVGFVTGLLHRLTDVPADRLVDAWNCLGAEAQEELSGLASEILDDARSATVSELRRLSIVPDPPDAGPIAAWAPDPRRPPPIP